ncbi:MAG: GerMN domain-containing protein, partial [Lachnospiraceae bacterium]|nr:GerMN domain-containing protein [Lachnospiraceae bacterium]
MNKKILWLLGLLLLLLTGCQAKEEKTSVKAERNPDEYVIYYTNLERTALKEAEYTVSETSFEGMLDQLLDQMQRSVDEETLSALPPEVKINAHTLIGIDNLCIDLNAGYLGLSRTSQMLLRAAMVKTLVQLPGIYHVSITVEGQPVAEESGAEIGPMDDNTFIISGGYGINFYHEAAL